MSSVMENIQCALDKNVNSSAFRWNVLHILMYNIILYYDYIQNDSYIVMHYNIIIYFIYNYVNISIKPFYLICYLRPVFPF